MRLSIAFTTDNQEYMHDLPYVQHVFIMTLVIVSKQFVR